MRTKAASGISINWLSDSSHKEISRIVSITQSDIAQNNGVGIEIRSQRYSVHNIKVTIADSAIYRNMREGVSIRNLGLSGIVLTANELWKNENDNLKITRVHHKANKKYAFKVTNCHFEYSKQGFGV